MWDVFISHASEDKDSFVDGLVERLKHAGLTIWYDRSALRLGDRLRKKIDEGLANSRYGIVVLSQNFLAKDWPRTELDGLGAREELGHKVILPIWHGVSRQEIARYSPTLADRLAISTDKGMDAVVREILLAVGSPVSDVVIQTPPPVSPELSLNPEACVVIVDGSAFSAELLAIVEESGFRAKQMTGTVLPFTRDSWDKRMGDAGLVVLTRGDHVGGGANPEFYQVLRDFIAGGGFVFATPWVSWETYGNPTVRDFLPFEHPAGGYSEAKQLAVELPDTTLEFPASFEHLGGVRPGARVLLTSTTDIPILGMREYGLGRCIYFNACQHACYGSMDSPLRSKGLRELVKQTFVNNALEMKVRQSQRGRNHSMTA